ncbi:MAG: hypothetical protein U9N61_04045 [Euryarchaeota archaeon]|nr:hypothetical protein [Euryarchaeota archaeon]
MSIYFDTINGIHHYTSANGFAPSLRDLANMLNVGTSAMRYRLNMLEKAGLVFRDNETRRTIRLANSHISKPYWFNDGNYIREQIEEAAKNR